MSDRAPAGQEGADIFGPADQAIDLVGGEGDGERHLV